MKQWILALILVLSTIQAQAAAKEMSIQVKKGVLKNLPSFLGQNIENVYYGDRVVPLLQEGDWVKVMTTTSKGWLHATALTDKQIVIQTGRTKAQTGVSSDEIVLAGKGFNAQVEATYREGNPKMRFDLVNTMERYSISTETERAFAKNGHLKFEEPR